MTSDYLEFAPRHPRHETTDGSKVLVVVRQPAVASADPIEARLVDLSRSGFQFHAPVSLPIDETITIEIRDDRVGLRLELSGIVRWQRPNDDGSWSVGCQCEQEVDWATMGELFLHEVLSMD
jgi:hypothetical protein